MGHIGLGVSKPRASPPANAIHEMQYAAFEQIFKIRCKNGGGHALLTEQQLCGQPDGEPDTYLNCEVLMQVEHPVKEQLVAFGQGRLAEAESVLVERHLEDCVKCCETLLDLKDDTFIGLVKRAPLSGIATFGKTPQQVPERLLAPTEALQRDEAIDDSVASNATVLTHEPLNAATMLLPSGQLDELVKLPVELIEHPRYEVRELIGRGGMGNVYRAEHRLMHRPVAIKLINAELVRHPQAVERFRREVQAAAKLSHPNIVAAYDAEQAGDVHFLVMEFVEGTDLASLINERGPMSVSAACECVRQAATGLQHAHEKGMVHRDIKPQNLMLTDNGQVRILDFGLAGFASEAGNETSNWKGQLVANHGTDETDETAGSSVGAGQLTRMGSVMGTPDYMAPEQASDAHAADIRADIYSLGCTLFFLLTGRAVFEAKSVVSKLTAHATEAPPALSALRSDVSAELQRVLLRMLAKRPEDRFQTPAELVAALEPLARSQVQKSQRFGLLIATLCCGLAVLLGGLILFVTSKGRLEIHSEVDDVKVAVKQGGEQVNIIDLKTGSQMTWLPSGDYELQIVGRDNDVKLDRTGFSLSRFGQAIVTARWSSENVKVVRGFTTNDKPITQDDVTVDDGGWKLTAKATRTVRLFEVPTPNFAPGPFFFRAKLRTENVVGRTYLEMWNRFPGKGEFFSKGLDKAISGTNDWAEYEIPFLLKPGEEPDLVKLNVVIEGTGTVWIKDIELRGRVNTPNEGTPIKSVGELPVGAMSESVTTGYNGGFEVTKSGLPVSWYFYTPRTVPNADFDILMDKMDFKEGEQSLKFVVRKCESTGGRLSPGFFNEFKIDGFDRPGPFETKPGETYKISFWAKNAESEFVLKARGVSALEGDKGVEIRSKESFNEWRRFECRYTIPPKMWLRLELNVVQPGTFWIDDFQIVKVNAAKPSADEKPINLLTDPSFENTGLTQLPRGWRGWLNDGQEFRCEVVAGGHSGQRCLKISGKGTRGVVFANDIKADRTKRYALKGWAKFEGDKDARAIIKFNYFKDGEFLGVHDLIGAMNDQGWQLFEKTDALDVYSTANHFYAMCHVEGSGTGWFDDLELVAYDRDKLPADFDERHGRHNRTTGANSLERWVGTWKTEFPAREPLNSPQETKQTLVTQSERTLGDYFLLSYVNAATDAPKLERTPRTADLAANVKAVGHGERLMFLTFDQNLGAFRHWLFSDNGRTYEARGQWDAAMQTLELRVLPDASNLISTERFVSGDRIEFKMRQQFVMGTRDMNQWTMTRTAANAKVDIPVVKTPFPDQDERSQLNKFVGEWTIRAKYKPSVWNPQPREETATESGVWILDGRFLMTKSFNAEGQLTAIWLATYDPTEKTNRFWFFNADGSSSESRLTWDAAASGFQFRAIDLPNGWTGTGFNHWVDADSFDNTAMIKDANGRVLLDMSQERRRKK